MSAERRLAWRTASVLLAALAAGPAAWASEAELDRGPPASSVKDIKTPMQQVFPEREAEQADPARHERSRDAEADTAALIEALNDEFGTQLGRRDRRFFDRLKESAKAEPEIVQRAEAGGFAAFRRALEPVVAARMTERRDENPEVVSRYTNDADFRDTALALLARQIYDELRAAGPDPGTR